MVMDICMDINICMVMSRNDIKLCADEGHQQTWTAPLAQFMQAFAGKWRNIWQVMSQYSGAAMRLQLALFYFYGLYYHGSHRATGAPITRSSE